MFNAAEFLERFKDNPTSFTKLWTNIWFDLDGTPQEPYPKQIQFMNVKNGPRIIVVLKARQVGLSSAIVAKVVHLAFFAKVPEIVIVSRTRAQAEKILKRVRLAFLSMPEWMRPEFLKETQQQIVLHNSVTIDSVSAVPESVRGRSGAVFLDEGGTFDKEDGYAIWEALFPSIAKGGTIHLIGTPQGTDNILYDLSTKSLAEFSGNKDTKIQSLRIQIPWQDCPHIAENIDLLRSGMTELQFRQEFCLEFIEDGEETYFPRSLMEKCSTEECVEFGLLDLPYMQLEENNVPENLKQYELLKTFESIYTGWDMAKIQDNSIVSVVGKRYNSEAYQLIGLFELHGDYESQAKLFSIISQLVCAKKCGFDTTSYGQVVKEFLDKTKIANRLHPVLFHPKTKIPMFSYLRGLMTQGKMLIPLGLETPKVAQKILWQFTSMEFNLLTQQLNAKQGEHDDIPCSIVCALEATRNKKSDARISFV